MKKIQYRSIVVLFLVFLLIGCNTGNQIQSELKEDLLVGYEILHEKQQFLEIGDYLNVELNNAEMNIFFMALADHNFIQNPDDFSEYEVETIESLVNAYNLNLDIWDEYKLYGDKIDTSEEFTQYKEEFKNEMKHLKKALK